MLRFRDAIPSLVLTWSLIGIILKCPDQRAMEVTGSLMAAEFEGRSRQGLCRGEA
jgi:hypothetical protein